MADPIGTTASILALVGVCAKIIEYIQDVKDGSSERMRLRKEIISTKGILEALITTVKGAEAAPEAWSETIRSIKRKGGPLDLLQEVLFALHDELSRAASANRVERKKDIEERLKVIERQQSLLAFALDNDHVALSKEIQGDTRAIRGDVIAIRAELEQQKDDENRATILGWLTPVDYTLQQHDFISRRQTGTGQWVLDSAEYQTWRQTAKSTLFCQGIPGAGKTILTSIVVEDLTTRFFEVPTVGIAYIYCNFRRKQEQRAEDLIASLLKQLSQSRTSLPETVKALYDKHKRKQTRPSIDELSQALQSASGGCRSRVLTDMFNLNIKYGANVFATSRPVPEITAKFDQGVSLEIRASKQDIEAYIEGNMPRLEAFDDWNEQLRYDIRRQYQTRFLLAQIYLQSLDDKTKPKAVKNALRQFQNQMPGSSEERKREILDQAYDDTLRRIQEQRPNFQQIAMKALAWITHAKRPLRIVELQVALAIEIGDPGLDKDNLEKTERIISVCAGLVTIQEESEIVEFVHYTTQEYMQRKQKDLFADAESEITKSCVTYLSFNVFDSGFCPTDATFEARLQANRLYDYAAHNWGHHARASGFCEGIIAFLKSTSKVEASSQALMAIKLSWTSTYSQDVPRRMSGFHLAAYFGVQDAVYGLLQHWNSIDEKDSYGQTPLSWAAENGHEAVVQQLLAKGAIVETKDDYGQTPLLWAAENGYEAVVQLLQSHLLQPSS
ncbi:hypothetical protein B0T26DRAFT_744167 [Lasiosphaeria miniovina]|uniref:Ankyrin repeat protein n=1 Tax=Lasiosphaeria miniovina TaxID=1954250 RepID=A0AA40DGV4_9PEZI|nr:uncharacterized protein B0T26DRAFT_744167 [Lasiosphaeria miniovina]KAK0703024.1 hypothetical protein B0T26DRAFT_744167 [Lasiosphaeria miniovina]